MLNELAVHDSVKGRVWTATLGQGFSSTFALTQSVSASEQLTHPPPILYSLTHHPSSTVTQSVSASEQLLDSVANTPAAIRESMLTYETQGSTKDGEVWFKPGTQSFLQLQPGLVYYHLQVCQFGLCTTSQPSTITNTVRSFAALYCTALHCTALYCTDLNPSKNSALPLY